MFGREMLVRLEKESDSSSLVVVGVCEGTVSIIGKSTGMQNGICARDEKLCCEPKELLFNCWCTEGVVVLKSLSLTTALPGKEKVSRFAEVS